MSFMPAPALANPAPRRPRRGLVLALLAAVLLLHGLLLGELGRGQLPSPRPGPLPAPVVWTRSVAVPVVPPTVPPPQTQPQTPPQEPPQEPPQQPLQERPQERLQEASQQPPHPPAPERHAAPVPRPEPMAKPPAPAEAAATSSARAAAAPPLSASSPAVATPPPVAVAPSPSLAAAAADDTDEPETAAPGGSAPPLYATRLPGPAQLRFQLRRGPHHGQALLRWEPADEDRYAISFDATLGGRPLFEQRSTGRSGAHGLSPERFQDKRRGRAAQHATFDADAQRIAFSGRAPDLPLWAGAQDRLGWIVQLAGIVAAAAQPPEDVRLHVVGARGGAGPWTFVARGIDEVATPLGPVQALRYERAPAVLRDQRVEAWLDPARGYWPVKLRLTPVLGGAPLELLLEEEPRAP